MPNNIRSNALDTGSLFTTTLFTPDTSYYVQEVNLPGVSINHPVENTRVGTINLQGDVLSYNNLNLRLLVDEKLNLWKEILATFQKYHIPGTNTCEPVVGESFLEVYDGKNNYMFKVSFHNCYLSNLEDLNYMSTSDNETLVLGLTIVYDYYTIE